MKTFAEILKHLRELENLTQAQLAEKLGFKGHVVITNWESGRRMPDVENLKLLSKFFKVSIDYLLGHDYR